MLCNIPEQYTREISHLLIYDANALTFNQNLRGEYPDPNDYLFKIDVQTFDNYRRNVRLKKQNKNFYFDIDIEFPFYNLSIENRTKLYSLVRNRKYMIVTASNVEMMALGNQRERLSIEILDNIKDDGSGKDSFIVKITGETIVLPRLRKVTPMFRVLLFAPPLQ